MRFRIYAIFFAFLRAKNIPIEQRLDDALWSKLKEYQKLTGLTEEKIMAIWQKSQDIESVNIQGFYNH